MFNLSYDKSGNLININYISTPALTISGLERNIATFGSNISFSILVTRTNNARYQWLFNGSPIPGANGDSLLINNVTRANEGNYSVVVTNEAGSITSAPAALMFDSDEDGLPDDWERTAFGNITDQRGEGDADLDNILNIDEFASGTNPMDRTIFHPRLIAYSDAGGSITVTPRKLEYNLGESVTLTANAFTPSIFAGWEGGMLGMVNTGSVIMNENKQIRAKFATPVPVPSGLIASWNGGETFEGDEGSGFFRGAIKIPSSISTNGKVRSAFNFDGTTYIKIPTSIGSALRPVSFSVEAWIYPTFTEGSVISVGTSGHGVPTWWLVLTSAGPTFITTHQRTPGDTVNLVSDTLHLISRVPLNDWTHLAISFDGSTKKIYVNGCMEDTHSGLGPLNYDATTGMMSTPLTIGSTWKLNEATNLFTGYLDEVCLYNTVLTDNDIYNIFIAGIAGKI